MKEKLIILLHPESFERFAHGDFIDREIGKQEVCKNVADIIQQYDLNLGENDEGVFEIDVRPSEVLPPEKHFSWYVSKEDDEFYQNLDDH